MYDSLEDIRKDDVVIIYHQVTEWTEYPGDELIELVFVKEIKKMPNVGIRCELLILSGQYSGQKHLLYDTPDVKFIIDKSFRNNI